LPPGIPLQIHTMEDDDWGDVDIARELAATVDGAELFLHPGDAHLFTDDSLPAYDEKAAVQVRQRTIAFLAAIDDEATGG
jgi:dienelactone hydrolase